MSFGHQLQQIVVARVVPGQKDQVIGTAFSAGFIEPATVGNVDFAADDGLDPSFFTGRVEVHHAVEAAVVGDG